MTAFDDKTILGIDCASTEMKLGLQYDADKTVSSSTSVESSHGQLIIREIAQLFRSVGITVDRLDAIVVATGPGSFTGLRIALAAAKGIAVSLRIPVAGVSMFEIAAARCSNEDGHVTVVVPFKRDAVFVGEIINGTVDSNSIESVSIGQLPEKCAGKNVVSVLPAMGRMIEGTADRIEMKTVTYDASELIRAGIAKLNEEDFPVLAELEPLYVQKSQAELRFEQKQRNKRD